MRVRITNGVKGVRNAIMPVYAKVRSKYNTIWYIVPSTKGCDVDNSYISSKDTIVYTHPDFTEENGCIRGENLPPGYTFIIGHDCEELPSEMKNNRDASILLGKEY